MKLFGRSEDVKRLCEAKTIEEQEAIWKACLRPVFVEGSLVQRLVNSPIFLWNALGVSMASGALHGCYIEEDHFRCRKIKRMLSRMKELFTNSSGRFIIGSPIRRKPSKRACYKQCGRDSLDPIGSHALLSKGAYHYLLVSV